MDFSALGCPQIARGEWVALGDDCGAGSIQSRKVMIPIVPTSLVKLDTLHRNSSGYSVEYQKSVVLSGA